MGNVEIRESCSDCGVYHDQHHPLCASGSIELKLRQLVWYYNQSRAHWLDLVRQREQVVFWQGKHALVRHENNKLRRKLHALKKEHER